MKRRHRRYLGSAMCSYERRACEPRGFYQAANVNAFPKSEWFRRLHFIPLFDLDRIRQEEFSACPLSLRVKTSCVLEWPMCDQLWAPFQHSDHFRPAVGVWCSSSRAHTVKVGRHIGSILSGWWNPMWAGWQVVWFGLVGKSFQGRAGYLGFGGYR